MKPVLVVGLGNPLMGDDGVGCAVAERLAGDSRLPEWVEVICGGSDLLRYTGEMQGRSRVVVIDAIQDESGPGGVTVFDESLLGLDERQSHAHQLSAVQAIHLLRTVTPARYTLVGISIASATATAGLSPTLENRMPEILAAVRQEVARHRPED